MDISYNVPTDGQTITTGTEVAPNATVSVTGGSDNLNESNVGDGDVLAFQVDSGSGFETIDSVDFSTINIAPSESEDIVFDGAESAIGDLEAGSYTHRVALLDSSDAVVSDTDGDYASSDQTLNVEDPDVAYEVNGNTQSIYYQGQDINATGLAPNTDYTLRFVDDFESDGTISSSSFEAEYEADADGIVEIDSSSLESGDYFLRGPGIAENRDNSFELTVQDFSAEWAEDSYNTGDEAAELEVDSQRNSYNVIISSDSLDYDELSNLFADADGPIAGVSANENEDDDEYIVRGFRDDSIIANFSNTDLSAGDYEFDLEVYDTEASDSAAVTLEEEDANAGFANSVTTSASGDVVEFTVELEDTDSTFVSIGGDSVGYFDVVYVEDDNDDDEVTFQVNTRTLGTDEADSAYSTEEDIVEPDAAGEGATFEDDNGNTYSDAEAFRTSQDGLDQGDLIRPIQPGEYDLIASDGEFVADSDNELVIDNELDIATLDLTTPTIDGVTTHVAPSASTDDADNVEQLLEEVNVSENVALNDRMVIQVEADGVEGDIAQRSGANLYELDEGVDGQYLNQLIDADEQAVTFDVEATSATANQDPAQLNFDQTTVYFGDGQFFVVVDTRQSNAFDRSVSDGDSFDVTYEYETDEDERYRFVSGSPPVWDSNDNADSFPYFGSDEGASAETSFTLEDREATFDNENADGDIEVEVAEDATLSGTTNVAPGTEISVRLRSASGVSPQFIQTDDDIEVAEDGTFEATVDSTEGEVGTEATARFRVGSTNVEEADAILVESVEQSATFEVSDLNPEEATATAGDSVDVSATIENTGNAEGTQTVALTLDGDELDTTEVTLADGNSTTVEFTADTSGLEAGDYEHGVATDNDEATGTLTIEASGDGSGDDSSGDDSSGDDSSGDDSSGDDSSGDSSGDSTDDGAPGFGALVALVALIAAALIATRRND
ncbi:probable cell surface glycoprotein [Halorubrum sp. DM2]|nr:probable cell surface glycoprotein [Halorubrum sp. DM2]